VRKRESKSIFIITRDVTQLPDNERESLRRTIKTTPAFPAFVREHAKLQSSRANATVVNQRHSSRVTQEKQLLALARMTTSEGVEPICTHIRTWLCANNTQDSTRLANSDRLYSLLVAVVHAAAKKAT